MIAKQVVKERKVWWHKNWWRVVFDWSFQGHHRTTLLPVCTRSVWFTMWFVCNVNVKEEQLSNKYREKSSPLWICNVKRSSLWIIPSLIKATIKFMVPTCRLEHLQSNYESVNLAFLNFFDQWRYLSCGPGPTQRSQQSNCTFSSVGEVKTVLDPSQTSFRLKTMPWYFFVASPWLHPHDSLLWRSFATTPWADNSIQRRWNYASAIYKSNGRRFFADCAPQRDQSSDFIRIEARGLCNYQFFRATGNYRLTLPTDNCSARSDVVITIIFHLGIDSLAAALLQRRDKRQFTKQGDWWLGRDRLGSAPPSGLHLTD